jgi:hypothetical protein
MLLSAGNIFKLYGRYNMYPPLSSTLSVNLFITTF